jgi:hypothetical protein
MFMTNMKMVWSSVAKKNLNDFKLRRDVLSPLLPNMVIYGIIIRMAEGQNVEIPKIYDIVI